MGAQHPDRRTLMLGLIKAEPVAVAGFVSILINLAISFGLHLSQDQVALINALVVAGLALIVRQNVTAPANAPDSVVIEPTPADSPPPAG
jgi:hypothetical protein